MSKTPLSKQAKGELLFLRAAGAACVLFVALAFWYAVPLKDAQPQPLPEQTTLTEYLRVDLNTADEETLCILPGIGPAKAASIVEYRTEHGAFAQLEEVLQVPGITQEIVDSWNGMAEVSG